MRKTRTLIPSITKIICPNRLTRVLNISLAVS
jgi:hypothetical protein